MRYIRCTLELDPPQPATEIFIATLAELGFESFEEIETGLKAYIQEAYWDETAFHALPLLHSSQWEVSSAIEVIEPQNWNAVWERDYHPIMVREQCRVRAPFHPETDVEIPYDIVISPKMSFGTGHHQTTHLMLDFLLDLELKGKSVLDVGTGTGVLAILAGMKGAGPITAIDIDPWSYENAIENTARNSQEGIEVLQGEVTLIAGRKYNVVLANINKNVLLAQLPAYAGALLPNGILVLSGFFETDLPELRNAARSAGLHEQDFRTLENWTAAVFRG